MIELSLEREQFVTIFLMLSVSEMNGLLQVFDRSWIVYYLNAKCTENPAFLVEKVTICFSHGASCWQSQLSAVQLKSFLCILTLRLSIRVIGKWAVNYFKQG